MRTSLKIALVSTTVGAALLVGAAAYASIPDSSGVIHACYQSPPPAHGANLQVIDTGNGGSCSGGMASLTFNQTGPQGPQGAAGATGATGAQGPAGPSTGGSSGLDLEIVTASGSSDATVTCPSSHPFLYGGGGQTGSGGALDTSFPTGGSGSESGTMGWEASVAGGVGAGVTAYAICGK